VIEVRNLLLEIDCIAARQLYAECRSPQFRAESQCIVAKRGSRTADLESQSRENEAARVCGGLGPYAHSMEWRGGEEVQQSGARWLIFPHHRCWIGVAAYAVAPKDRSSSYLKDILHGHLLEM